MSTTHASADLVLQAAVASDVVELQQQWELGDALLAGTAASWRNHNKSCFYVTALAAHTAVAGVGGRKDGSCQFRAHQSQ
jgi:hypothetical protein